MLLNKAEYSVLVVDDEFSQREIIHDIIAEEGYAVEKAASGDEALRIIGQYGRFDAVVTDLKMPGEVDGLGVLKAALEQDENTVVVLMTAYGTVESAVEAMKIGATDYLNKPINHKDELLIILEKALQNRKLVEENIELHRELESRYHFDNIIGSSKSMNEVYRLVGKVLGNDSTVMISGDSGTGKELVARAIHYNGMRKEGPFVALNCAAIPANLIESELFGHEKGAFSGANSRRVGKFESADGGTLFLDEVSALEYDLQAKFLRVLQEREFQRVGGDSTIKADVRIIAATNRPLRKMVAEGKFRDDLYHRLNVVNIELPPLKRRKSDIPLLVRTFLDKFSSRYDRPAMTIAVEVVEALQDYDWPGNVRELENLIEQLVVLADGNQIKASDLPSYVYEDSSPDSEDDDDLLGEEYEDEQQSASGQVHLPAGGIKLAGVEKSLITEALNRTGGRLTSSCKLLGISYKTLQYRIKKYGIDVTGFKD